MSREGRESSEDEPTPPSLSTSEQRRADARAWGEHSVDQPDRRIANDSTESKDKTKLHRSPEEAQTFQRALDSYRLDKVSMEKAVATGAWMAHELRDSRWLEGSMPERTEALKNFVGAATVELNGRPCEAVVDSDSHFPTYGGMNDHQIVVAEWVLESDDPALTVDTVAHEARHRWQDDVVAGRLEHPAGERAREALIQAHQEYDKTATNFRLYDLNEKELDARVYAAIATIAYHTESQNITNAHAATARRLAQFLPRLYNSSEEEL